MDTVCLVMASHTWMEGVVPECGRQDEELRLEIGRARAAPTPT